MNYFEDVKSWLEGAEKDKGISNLEYEDLSDDLQSEIDEAASEGWAAEDVIEAAKELMLDGMPEDDITKEDLLKHLDKK